MNKKTLTNFVMCRPARDGVTWIRPKMSKKGPWADFWGSPTKGPKKVKKRSWGPAGLRQDVKKMSKKGPQTFSGPFLDLLKPFW